MLKTPHGRRLVAGLPIERLLTETDGPFVQLGARPIRPTDLEGVISELAEVKNTSVTGLSERVVQKLKSLVSR